ncbi:MAG: hypothetical protein WCR54_04925 [Clostridia bacterium]
MKKKFISVILSITLMLCLVSCIHTQSNDDYFLVQIIPNDDQNNTTKITNCLNLYLSNLLVDCTDNLQINDKITDSWEEIEKLLNEYELEYSALITTKTYSEIVFNNQILHKGDYCALIINFGNNEKASEFLLYSSSDDCGKTPILKSRILERL